ncbi:hydrogenase expression/formation protein [Seohaeicola saemankumensis]|nr:hydrogenase expression/formation protein [Seohaeicola saemankumensis]MCA0869535.1 hydrogenase expression/formation protein [Seohaeicola saemankumensis]
MVSNFHLPPTGYGPGSQPSDEGAELEYMQLPQDMRAYTAHIPEVEFNPALTAAMEVMGQIARAADSAARGGANTRFDLSGLNAENRALVAETMGHGEVSIRMHGIPAVAAQESVFAGIWSLKGAGLDAIEVGPVPAQARSRAFEPLRNGQGAQAAKTPAVINAPPLLVELTDKSRAYTAEDEVHVINLSLLPHTEDDLAWLDMALGQGSVDILSRGYGNCRVTSTAMPHVWKVQFFNSMDTLILDTYEVTDMPEVAIAAPEDLADSAGRLREVLEAIR